MLSCLNNIVGVLSEATPIITQGLPTEEVDALQVSTSGLFLDKLPGGVDMKALKYTDATKPFSKMAFSALELAAKNLEDDLIVALREKYDKSRKNFLGQIGQMSYATTLATNKRFQFIRIRPVDYIDGVMLVNRFNMIFNGNATFTLHLLEVPADSVMGTEIKSFPLTVTANQFKTVDLVGENLLTLPLIRDGQKLEYWFYYDMEEIGPNVKPKDMKLACSTCGIRSTVNDYVEVTGGQLDSVNQLHVKTVDSYAHGLVLDVSISCNTGGIFCKEYNSEEAVALTMAYGVWYKAGELLIEDVLKSPDVNRYTTQSREYLWGKRNHFRALFETRIKYLASVIDVSASNCYVCRQQENQPQRGAILI